MPDLDALLTEAEELIARAWLAHKGYTPAEVDAEYGHTEACFFEYPNWTCTDEYGVPNHPTWDAIREASEVGNVAAAALRSVQVPVTEGPRLNPRVVLAALDQALAPSGLHRGAHLSTLRLQVKRLRDHVAEYVSPEPLPSPGTTTEEE